MKIEKATPDDVSYVAARIRDCDYIELLETSSVNSRYQLVEDLVRRFGYRDDVLVAKHKGEPVAIGSLAELRPNVITLAFFATDDFPAVGKRLTRFLAKIMIPTLEAAGVHRFEALSIEGHGKAHAWLGALGLRREARLQRYGRNGANFISFARVSDVVKNT